MLSLVFLICFYFIQSVSGYFDNERLYDPIVFKGSDLPELLDSEINHVVAFAFQSDSTWSQIPIQIDEKHWQDWAVIKNGDCR